MTSKILVIDARAHKINIKTVEEHLFDLGMSGHDFDSAEVVDEETRQEMLPMNEANAAVLYIHDPVNGWDTDEISAGAGVIAEYALMD